MEFSEPPPNVPSLGLSLSDIQVLSTLIGSYLVYLRRGVSPSKQRNTNMVLLADIHRRMLAMIAANGGVLLLTTAEIEALAEALQGFVTLMGRMIAPSQERNETLQQIRAMRRHVLEMLEGKSY